MKTKTDSRTAGAPPGSLHPVVRHYVVLWDDEQGVCCPMGWDEDCEGSLCCINKTIAIFDSRKAARKAINISAKYSHLCLAQGKPVNLDFVGKARKNLRIVECVPNACVSESPARDAARESGTASANGDSLHADVLTQKPKRTK